MAVKIILNRKNEWVNWLRNYKVLVDDEQIDTISNVKTEEFEAVKVSHSSIEYKIDWSYSNKFFLSTTDEQTVYLRVPSGLKSIWLVFIIFPLHLWIRVNTGFIRATQGIPVLWFQVALLTVLVVCLVYFLTAGRRKYLVLKKDSSNIFVS